MSLIRMLSDGPEVSLRGSPTVSPITAALCASEPLGPRDLACSEAPAYQKTNNRRMRNRLIDTVALSQTVRVLESLYGIE